MGAATVMDRRRHLAAVLGITGSVLGVAAGTVQAVIGARIPDWTGAKQAPESLGLLTVALSLLAGWCAYRQARPGVPDPSRVGCAAGLILSGLLCFTTVGRLWYLSGPLLIAAGLVGGASVRDTLVLLTRHWPRVLLALLGGAELMMAAGAAPVVLVVGGVGGGALVAAAARARSRPALAVLVVVGTVPFAALAWTALVPLLLLLAAAVVTVPLLRRPAPAPRVQTSRPSQDERISQAVRWRAGEASARSIS